MIFPVFCRLCGFWQPDDLAHRPPTLNAAGFHFGFSSALACAK